MRALLDAIAQRFAASTQLDGETRTDAKRESRLLAAAVLECAPGEIARRMDEPLPDSDRDRIIAAAERRARGEPLAYAVGTAPFRHLVLRVDHRVLIPRPETEGLVEATLEATRHRAGGIAVDIGTGSGAIALALATEGQFDRVVATDVSADALEVARLNAQAVHPRIPVEFRLGSDLAPLEGLRAHVIVSNPPYIAYDEASALPASVRDWEPATALFAADGGMARYDVLLAESQRFLEPGGVLVLELDARRAGETATRAERLGWLDIRILRDLSGRERVLVARSPIGS
jgi:release factor glutamine methyltransferase